MFINLHLKIVPNKHTILSCWSVRKLQRANFLVDEITILYT